MSGFLSFDDLRDIQRDPVADVELDDDFGTTDPAATITDLLVRGESRDRVADLLKITRADVDEHVATATASADALSLDEREWITRERLASLVRQASRTDLAAYEVARLAFLLDVAKVDLELIRSHGTDVKGGRR